MPTAPPNSDQPAADGDVRPVLSIRDLRVAFETIGGSAQAVRGVSLDLMPGRTLAVVGESGSGKSVSAYSILRLLPDNARCTGRITLRDADDKTGPGGGEVDVLALPPNDPRLMRLRGGGAGMIFQEPMTALSPVHRGRRAGGRSAAAAPPARPPGGVGTRRWPCSNGWASPTRPAGPGSTRSSSAAA